MIPTSPSDRFEDLLSFLVLAGGKEFEEALARSQGASGRELIAFMSLCRFPLPQLYIDYLKRFGRSDGGLNLFGDPDADIEELVRRYQAYERVDYRLLPDNVVVFAIGALSGHILFVYSDGSCEPCVASAVYDEEGVIDSILAESFTRYIYTRSFRRFKLPSQSGEYLNLLGYKQVLTPLATEVALRHGFTSYWFSDAYSTCLERDGLIFCSGPSGRGTEVYLTGPRKPRDEFAAALVAEVGLKLLSRSD